ncbi:hypothetical protein GJ496_005604 [Pomphorhynchus laevis]|nr:hypothetical protein GJ496_005604 [Pomphorhynchus laevis]
MSWYPNYNNGGGYEGGYGGGYNTGYGNGSWQGSNYNPDDFGWTDRQGFLDPSTNEFLRRNVPADANINDFLPKYLQPTFPSHSTDWNPYRPW